MEEHKIKKLITHFEEDGLLEDMVEPDGDQYSCLPLAVLDAIFSINARYRSAENVVKRYCDKYSVELYREKDGSDYQTLDDKHTINNLIINIDCGAAFDVGALGCLRLEDFAEFYV